MKISQEEIDAVSDILAKGRKADIPAIARQVLEAAKRVRKQRKKAKAANIESRIEAMIPPSEATPTEFDGYIDPHVDLSRRCFVQAINTPVWNGKFEAGKSYRTRNGQKVSITLDRPTATYCLYGVGTEYEASWWQRDGRFYNQAAHKLDLIGPWED